MPTRRKRCAPSTPIRGVTERYGFAEVDGQSVFRYVSAMEVSENCIECHGGPAGRDSIATGYPKEGWEVGDVAGAVSVEVPTDLSFANMTASIANNVLFFLLLMACMAAVVYVVLSRLVTDPLTDLRASLALVADGSRTFLDRKERPVPPCARPDAACTPAREVDGPVRAVRPHGAAPDRPVREPGVPGLRAHRAASAANLELDRQRRRVEEINAQLARDNRYKSDFLAIVSHELRTPLTSILAFADLMADTVDPADAASRRQLEEIEKNGAVLLEMVDNVLETARIQAGSERLNLELVDLNDVVGMVEASNQPVALKKGVAMSTAVDADVPLITSDWEKVRRILVNLVSNAVKFTPAGGRVDVHATWVPERSRVRIDVADTGIGIPSDKQDLIFGRFTQENMSTVRRYGGSGLGLSLVKDLVGMLGGTVGVDQRGGEDGSTFSVELPQEAQDAGVLDGAAGEGRARRPSRRGGLRARGRRERVRRRGGCTVTKIMLVDDDESMRLLIEQIVRRDGYDFCCAGCGEEGLSMLRAERPDFLILDVMLPDTNGFEICQTIRAEGRKVPIMFLTAKGDIVDKSIGFKAGADDYLVEAVPARRALAAPAGAPASAEAGKRRRGRGAEAPDAAGRLATRWATWRCCSASTRCACAARRCSCPRASSSCWSFWRPTRAPCSRATRSWSTCGATRRPPIPSSITVFVRKIREKIEDDPSKPVVPRDRRGASATSWPTACSERSRPGHAPWKIRGACLTCAPNAPQARDPGVSRYRRGA